MDFFLNNEKLPPEIIKQINAKQLNNLNEKVYTSFPDGSPEARKYAMQIRLAKKLNEKEYAATLASKRKSTRWN